MAFIQKSKEKESARYEIALLLSQHELFRLTKKLQNSCKLNDNQLTSKC